MKSKYTYYSSISNPSTLWRVDNVTKEVTISTSVPNNWTPSAFREENFEDNQRLTKQEAKRWLPHATIV